jgi:hypothetical protein
MNVRLALPLATLLLASTGQAALAAEPAAAGELARIIVPKSTWSEGVDGLAKDVQNRMRAHPGSQLQYPDDFNAKVRSEMEQVLPYEEVIALHAKELAAAYTPAELDGLVEFYRGPLGQKTLQVNPQVFQKVGVATQQRINSKMGEVMKRLAEHVKAPAGASAGASPHGGSGGSPHGASPHGATPPAKAAAPAKKAPAAPAKKTSPPPAKADAAATPAPAPAPAK